MSNIVPIQGRPLTGVYPSCPPTGLIDCMAGLEQCYSDVKRAQWFIKQIMIDIINCDPSIIGRGTPIVGVTDGSDAQPGMVGEFIYATADVPYAAYPTQTVNPAVAPLVIPPGDWDVWGRLVMTGGFGVGAFFITTPPAGMSNNMGGWTGVYDNGTTVTSAWVIGMTARASFSTPTLPVFTVIVDQSSDASLGAGTAQLWLEGRRRR